MKPEMRATMASDRSRVKDLCVNSISPQVSKEKRISIADAWLLDRLSRWQKVDVLSRSALQQHAPAPVPRRFPCPA
ncbi:hypothetical protein ASE66_21480 [Bosea sp. Root483D1]|nr:hypothetical protein ASE66_21480 [Bosea sp. Root483D1]